MLEILLYRGLGLLDSPRNIGLPTPWHKVIGTLCIVEAVDARYIPSIEIYNIIVCQNRVVERCPQQHERTSAGFVVNVAPESEIRLPVTQKSEHGRGEIDLRHHTFATPLQAAVGNVHKAGYMVRTGYLTRPLGKLLARNMIGDENKYRAIEPILARKTLEEAANRHIGILNRLMVARAAPGRTSR